MIPLIEYGFLQKALISGIMVAISCSLIGVFLVLRKNAFIGEGLAHLSFAGIALGLVLSVNPTLASVVFTICGALLISFLMHKTRLHDDTSIGIISYTGFALGILIISLKQGTNVDLFTYLFGNILLTSGTEAIVSIIWAVAVVGFVLVFYERLSMMTFDPETARTEGIDVRRLDTLFMLVTAITVVFSIRLVGVILASSLIIMPAASSLLVSPSLKNTFPIAAMLAALSVMFGLMISFYLDLATGATIVIFNFFIFLFFSFIGRR